jgi:hypothetical protein
MGKSVAHIDLRDHGQVKAMRLPQGWVEAEVNHQPFDLATTRMFHPEGNPQTRLCFYYRGGPVSPNSAGHFCKLLEQSPHELTESEWWEIQEVLGDAAVPGSFEKAAASSRDWQGKRVVVLQGRWPEEQQDSFSLFINADGGGLHVQEIHFVAAAEDFAKHLPSAQGALESIKWK